MLRYSRDLTEQRHQTVAGNIPDAGAVMRDCRQIWSRPMDNCKHRAAVRNARRACWVVLALLVASGWTRVASAVSFAPVACSQCPVMTELNWTYNLSASTQFELPRNPNCQPNLAEGSCPRYINNLRYTRYALANRNVAKFGIRLDSFATEAGFDALTFGSIGVNLSSSRPPFPRLVLPAAHFVQDAGPLLPIWI